MKQREDESNQDQLYQEPMESIPRFSFNEEVASVFDDMASRSIPFYTEVQRLTVTLAQRYARPQTRVYDLGCSTGTTMVQLRNTIATCGPGGVSIRGVDSSTAMCRHAEAKLGLRGAGNSRLYSGDGGAKKAPTSSDPEQLPASRNAGADHSPSYPSDGSNPEITVVHGNLIDEPIENASVVIMNYTLQFVSPQERYGLVTRILRGLVPGGVLLVSDKTLQSSTDVSRAFADIYYELKRRQGYSDLEIAQKRAALENVLIPYRIEEERELFLSAGFRSVDIFFSWCNFTSYVCVKNELS